MATVPVKAYKGGWKQGSPITLYPQMLLYDSNSSHYPPLNGTFSEMSQNPEYYDNNVTIFTPPWATDVPPGFTHRIKCETGENNFYIAPTSYICVEFSPKYRSCNTRFYYKGNMVAGKSSNQRYGVTCLSYARSELYAWYNYYVKEDYESYGGRSVDKASEKLVLFWSDAEIQSNDPYSKDPNGESTQGGGTGNFDGTGDDITIPGLPTLSSTDTGFITLFNPSSAQLLELASYMWSNLFDLNTFKKLFADPMDCILGLSIVPVNVPSGGTGTVSVGNISTGISMTKAASQYVEVDCGTLNVNEYWGAYLDYAPFTKSEIYLPYIGTHPIDVDDIMGKSVHVVYHIDILSGACTAYVKCGGSVLYEFIGQCSSSIPITGNDWTNVINGVISIAGSIGTMVATGGASAPMSALNIASTSVNTMKPSVEKSGAMSGTGGMLAIQTPYLILTRPRQALPREQNKFMGYPSFITEKLDSISGYTEIESVHLENIPATEQELSEIENLLKGGVIF